jgi:hypothetical protein
MLRVSMAGWPDGQAISTRQPEAAKAMDSRAAENQRRVVTRRTFGSTGIFSGCISRQKIRGKMSGNPTNKMQSEGHGGPDRGNNFDLLSRAPQQLKWLPTPVLLPTILVVLLLNRNAKFCILACHSAASFLNSPALRKRSCDSSFGIVRWGPDSVEWPVLLCREPPGGQLQEECCLVPGHTMMHC